MKRQVRRSLRKIGRKFSQVRSAATTLIRSRSSYYPSSSVSAVTSSPSSENDDDDNGDAGFEPVTPNELSEDDGRRRSVTMLPCEFCASQHPSDCLQDHQLSCGQNPNRPRTTRANQRRPGIRTRRAISEPESPIASAPPRTRSPSPTDRYPTPEDLQCPITSALFRDPVVATDGHTYERNAIIQWLRSNRISPMTREHLSVETLHTNRIIKKMADDFRDECHRKKSLYKYKLDYDVKKTAETPYIKTNHKSIYQAEWIKKIRPSNSSNIILLHLTGDNAEKLAESLCRLTPHPNITHILGKAEHNGIGVLLVQELSSTKTLSQLLTNSDQNLSIENLDIIIHQLVSALRHLTNAEIIHGNITSDNILVYHLNDIPENISIKLTNIGDIEKSADTSRIAPEVISNNIYSEKSDVYAFGLLAREMYSFTLTTDHSDKDIRDALFECCLATNPDERPTFNDLLTTISQLIDEEKCIL